MRNAATQKRSTKWPHFNEDDCTFSVYLSLVVYDFLKEKILSSVMVLNVVFFSDSSDSSLELRVSPRSNYLADCYEEYHLTSSSQANNTLLYSPFLPPGEACKSNSSFYHLCAKLFM